MNAINPAQRRIASLGAAAATGIGPGAATPSSGAPAEAGTYDDACLEFSPPWVWPAGLAAGTAWVLVAAVTASLPDADDLGRTDLLAVLAGTVGGALLVAAAWPAVARRVQGTGPWLLALALLLGTWELVTAKYDLLPRPFFAAPQSILEVFTDDWPRLCQSLLHSLLLLLPAALLGAAAGFLTGTAMGWSRRVGYWVHPVLRLLGPLPAVAWIPVAFFAFPSSRSASTFLIALATFFPVTVLTWSGVASVPAAYYDVARTMGASTRFLLRRVAVPAALPSVFVGLFMGLGASFSVLVVAEMLGVKAGLGFYLQWSQGWAAYANMYAALLVMAGMCSGLVTLLFRVRDRWLAWQRGVVRW